MTADAASERRTALAKERADHLMVDLQAKIAQDFPGYTVEPAAVKLFSATWNVDFPVTDADGAKWLARIRDVPEDFCPKKVVAMFNATDLATMQYLESADASTPRVRVPKHHKGEYYLVESLPGKPASGPVDIKGLSDGIRQILFQDFASHFIALSKVPYTRGIGSLNGASDTYGFEVGPHVHWRFVLPEAPYFAGPFKTNLERYTSRLDQFLRALEKESLVTFKSAAMYLAHLEIRRIINTCDEMRNAESQFYLLHGEGAGYHFLIENGRLTGVVDWDWSEFTTKAEAFAAAPAFVDVRLFYEGSNELSEAEQLLIKGYHELGREDLAECVRDGKKYQRLWTMVGVPKTELPNLKGLQAAFDQPVDKQETLEEWCKMAIDRYKEEVPTKIYDFIVSYQ